MVITCDLKLVADIISRVGLNRSDSTDDWNLLENMEDHNLGVAQAKDLKA